MCQKNICKADMQRILTKVDSDELLTREDAVTLLRIDNYSEGFYTLLAKANELSRKEYGDKGYVFAQIGLNSSPCPGNCKFCSLAYNNFVVEKETEKTREEVLDETKQAVEEGVDALFLMTTADYDFEKYLEISREVKKLLPEDTMFIANIGDFDETGAKKLKEAGFTGAYHIVRLNEGIDTNLPVEQRERTLDAIQKAGLELTKIVAVTRLVTRPKKSMNVHEPKQMALLAGVNQLYAEIGINPRDCAADTELNRGSSIEAMRDMLKQAGYSR